MKKFLILLLPIFLLFSGISLAGEKTLTFTWEHDKKDLAGFRLYMAEAPNVPVNVNNLVLDIPYTGQTDFVADKKLTSPDGETRTYYFVMTAYDPKSPPNESGPSNEVFATIDLEGPATPFSLKVTVSTE